MNSTLVFDPAVYALMAIEKAAYRFSDRFICQIETTQVGLKVTLKPKRKDTSEEAHQVALDDFQTEVLDQNLREKIKLETATTRNLILAHAFSRTGLVEQ
ncbi:MAG: His-Xaa-Ser system protein HxsD [Aeromonas sp.]|uniref:His-Xaa-Ser system protein HxsD n=1 Tax=Aeromonas sp. TaxID=647 RepID=UPI002FC8B795